MILTLTLTLVPYGQVVIVGGHAVLVVVVRTQWPFFDDGPRQRTRRQRCAVRPAEAVRQLVRDVVAGVRPVWRQRERGDRDGIEGHGLVVVDSAPRGPVRWAAAFCRYLHRLRGDCGR